MSLIFGAAGTSDTSKSYLWGLINIRKNSGIKYEKGYWTNRLFHRREFHEPVNLIPLELRYGIGFNGGGGKEGKAVRSNWMRYEQPVTGFKGGSFTARIGHQVELDVLKTNISYYLFNSSWADIHTGLNFRYASIFFPATLPTNQWGTVQSSWAVSKRYFAPRLLEMSVSNSANLQWFESWFLSLRYTYGLATAKFYRSPEKVYDQTPRGWGPSVSYSIGIRYILDPGMNNRFAVGLDFKHAYTKINRISDPDNLTPITRFDLSNYGLFLTISAFYGGKKTVGDVAKDYYYHRDYVTAKQKFQEFISLYPQHANRYRAEAFIRECDRKIPLQYMREGMSFDERKLTDKALNRYLQARSLTDDTTLAKALDERIAIIARDRMYRAEELLAEGKAREALSLVEKTVRVSEQARKALPRFRAQAILKEGRTALDNGFVLKALELLDRAEAEDPEVRIETGLLRYQAAIQLVTQANRVTDFDAIELAIQSLEKARELTGGLGTKNDQVLKALKEKLAAYETLETQRRIEKRMERERKAMEFVKRKKLAVGMTIPEVQDLLGEPSEIVRKTTAKGKNSQLWIYQLKNGRTLQLSFLEFILFKIEEE
ncbi:MAG: hypothetical protein GXO92_00090 [FCB group bacterium]|nr:hypothetical protein [FCB group bacterium]